MQTMTKAAQKATRARADGSPSFMPAGLALTALYPGLGLEGQLRSYDNKPLVSQPPLLQCVKDENHAGNVEFYPGWQSNLQKSASGGKPLAPDLRHSLEDGFGHSLKDVRIISDINAARIADRLEARAFTVGRNIWFAHGEFRPETMEGRRLLAHELAHTLQQDYGSNGLQRDIAIGQDNDPAEREADRAAVAVLKGERVPAIRQRPGVLRREARRFCTVSSASRPDQRIVQCGDQRYRVTFVITERSDSETRTSADLGWNNSIVYLDFEICRGGTSVNIRPSINLPRAMVDVVANLLEGSDALQGVSLTPELRITIVQSRSYVITLQGGPTIGMGSREVTGGQGSISVGTRVGRFGAGVEASRGRGSRGMTWMFNISYAPGDFRPETRDCTRRRKRLRMRCERLTTTPAVPTTPAVTQTLRREVYLEFPYSKSNPIERIFLREGTGTPQPSSLTEAPGQLATLGTQGYRVRSIEGFASPEGPRPPSPRTWFIGNIRLAEDRADRAKAWLIASCPNCGGQSITPVGRSEMFSPGLTPELEGIPLAERATREFLASTDPRRPEMEAERQALAQAPVQTRRAIIYPRLRRAVIALEREVIDRPAQPGRPARVDEPTPTACPSEVQRAVSSHLGIRITNL
jgi:hypothetical protein